MKTKFFRALLYYNRSGMNNTKGNFDLVPLLNFTFDNEINWNLNISEIDEILFTKYGLSKNEIRFIEENIKPM